MGIDLNPRRWLENYGTFSAGEKMMKNRQERNKRMGEVYVKLIAITKILWVLKVEFLQVIIKFNGLLCWQMAQVAQIKYHWIWSRIVKIACSIGHQRGSCSYQDNIKWPRRNENMRQIQKPWGKRSGLYGMTCFKRKFDFVKVFIMWTPKINRYWD